MDAPAFTSATHDPALCAARTSLCRFVALALLDPRGGAWGQLRGLRADSVLTAAAELLRDEALARPVDLSAGERPPIELDPRRVLDRLPDSPERLNEHYERVFGLLATGACPPHETDYVNGKFEFQRSQALADVNGFYRAFGLEASRRVPVRPDHIVLELEFMAFVAGLERRAASSDEAGGVERVATCRSAQRRFLTEHLAWWAPRFALLLVNEDPDGFYGGVAVFLGALLAAERSFWNIPAPDLIAEPSLLERPEDCEGCELVV